MGLGGGQMAGGSRPAQPYSAQPASVRLRIMSTEPRLPEPLSWRVHPLLEEPLRALLGVFVVLAAGWFVMVLADSPLAGAGSAFLLVGVLHVFFFGARYGVDAEGVRIETLWARRTLAWDRVRSVRRGTRGVWLSSATAETWRQASRGVLLLYGRRRPDVEPVLTAWLAQCGPANATCGLQAGDTSEQSG